VLNWGFELLVTERFACFFLKIRVYGGDCCELGKLLMFM